MWITPRIGAGTNLYYCPYRTLLSSFSTARNVCPCPTMSLSLSSAQICLSLPNTIALLVYRGYMSVLVARCCSPCLMALDKESNSVREGQHSIYWKKNSTFYTHVFPRRNTHRMKAGNLILRGHIKSSQIIPLN